MITYTNMNLDNNIQYKFDNDKLILRRNYNTKDRQDEDCETNYELDLYVDINDNKFLAITTTIDYGITLDGPAKINIATDVVDNAGHSDSDTSKSYYFRPCAECSATEISKAINKALTDYLGRTANNIEQEYIDKVIAVAQNYDNLVLVD